MFGERDPELEFTCSMVNTAVDDLSSELKLLSIPLGKPQLDWVPNALLLCGEDQRARDRQISHSAVGPTQKPTKQALPLDFLRGQSLFRDYEPCVSTTGRIHLYFHN